MIGSCEHCCMKINGLGVKFGRYTALENINLHINCGELLTVIGPNGAGKTTLLRAILKEIPFAGTVDFRVRGEKQRSFRIGYVPQKLEFDSTSPISVFDLISAAVHARPVCWSVKTSLREEIKVALDKVSAGHLLARKVGELSGGELQRVLLAMAMTPPPQLLLLDEPVSAVDAQGLSLFYQTVSEIRKQHDVSIIMITHDIAGIAPFADRMILLNRSILADDRPPIVLADAKLLKNLGPSLWNVSKLLELNTSQKQGEQS